MSTRGADDFVSPRKKEAQDDHQVRRAAIRANIEAAAQIARFVGLIDRFTHEFRRCRKAFGKRFEMILRLVNVGRIGRDLGCRSDPRRTQRRPAELDRGASRALAGGSPRRRHTRYSPYPFLLKRSRHRRSRWIVFPQIAGLGSSAMAVRYAIGSPAEARAYLAHPVLGDRLRECVGLVVAAGRPLADVFGSFSRKREKQGQLVHSCSVQFGDAIGKKITTIEGLAQNGILHRVQKAWIEHDVPQCGYCQSGMITAVAALLKEKPSLSDADVDDAITNICRCGTFQQVREAKMVSGIDVKLPGMLAGSFVYGLSALFHGGITIKDGRVEQRNFDDYPSMLIKDIPKVETIVMPSGGFWGGVGEPTICDAAPAVLNAYFAATGKRIRSVPLKNEGVELA